MPTSSLPLTNPKTYDAIDKTTKEQVFTKTAENASDYVKLEKISDAIENAKDTIENEMKNLAESITNASIDSKEAIIVEGTSMKETIEDIADQIKEIGKSVLIHDVESLYEDAVNSRNHIQDLLNKQVADLIISEGFNPQEK